MKSHGFTMLFILTLAALLLAACGSSAPAATAQPTSSGDAAAGKTAFEGTCVTCHGADAKGLPGLGKDLTNSEFIKDSSDPELIAFVKQGRPASDPANTTGVDMPPKGGNPVLNDTDIANIIAYLRTLAQ